MSTWPLFTQEWGAEEDGVSERMVSRGRKMCVWSESTRWKRVHGAERCACLCLCVSACRRRVGLAAAEIDEDSVRRGSESVIKLPEHLAEERGVEGKKKSKRGQRVAGSRSRICAGEDADTNPLTPVIMIIRPWLPLLCAPMERELQSKESYPPFEIIDPCSFKISTRTKLKHMTGYYYSCESFYDDRSQNCLGFQEKNPLCASV